MKVKLRNWRTFVAPHLDPVKDPVVAGLLAALTGVIVGYAALGFRLAISGIQWLGFGTTSEDLVMGLGDIAAWQIVGVPVLAGICAAFLIRYLLKDRAAGSIAEVIDGHRFHEGKLSFRYGLGSALTTVISLGGGASGGREGPIVHLGATISSRMVTWLGAPPLLNRTLLACGIAAAVAASFNAPIAGVFFATEVILGHNRLHSFAPIVIASIVATIVSRVHIGDFPAFIIPDYQIVSFWEFPAFLLLGITAGLVAVGFMRTVLLADNLAARLGKRRWMLPPVAGLIIGLMALHSIEILGVGYGATDAALKELFTLPTLVQLLLLKIVATAICLACRFGSGVFSPALYLGAMLGGGFGIVAAMVFPQFAASHGLYAIVGMGAVAAAVLGAPISTILIVFELTGDYQVTLALMAAVVVANLTTSSLFGPSFFHAQLKRRGLRMDEDEARRKMRLRQVKDVMSQTFVTVPLDAPLPRVRALVQSLEGQEVFAVDGNGVFKGTIRLKDLTTDVFDKNLDQLVRACDLARPQKSLILQTDSLAQALSLTKVANEDTMPVLDDLEGRRIVGVVSRTQLLATFQKLLDEAAAG
ncbi:MAG: chloride channel protein [Pseudomonadota bacterium]